MPSRTVSDARATLGRALAATWDEASSLILSRLGVRRGWRCLVAGPGTGHLARWLADAGAVVSTTDDEDVPGSGAVELVRWRIGRDPIPVETFDLIVSRLELARLPDPLAGLRSLRRGLRPGGWIFCEASDWVSLMPIGSDPSFEQVREACAELLGAHGHALDLGRHLPGLLREVGFADVDSAGRVLTLRGHRSPLGDLMLRTIDVHRAELLERGHVRAADIDRFMDRVNAPGFDALSSLMVSAWGKHAPQTPNEHPQQEDPR